MSDYREMCSAEEQDADEIDLKELMQNTWQGIKKFWWFIVLMMFVCAAVCFLLVRFVQTPNYIASASMSVKEMQNPNYSSIEATEKMEMVFPYIMESGVLEKVILKDLGEDEMPGKVWVSAEKGTNIFTVYASAKDPQTAYDLMQSVIENYPRVAEYVIGVVRLDVVDETGVPTDSGQKAALAGAVKKGAFIGLLLGLLPIAVWVWTRRTIKSKKDLQQFLNLRELGTIPFLRAKKRKKEQFLNMPSLMNERIPQNYLESVKRFSNRVLSDMEEKSYKSILVTSSIPGEGKTTTAVNLAITAAKMGKKVILVDCDPRNPSVAQVMNENRSFAGLGAVLRGETEIEKALTTVNISGKKMRVLYGGEASDKDSRLLGTKAMHSLIENLCEMADLVILDTAPSALLTDSSQIAKYTDAACYVVRCDYVKEGQIEKGIQALSMSNVDILGYVFNGDTSSHSDRYGYYSRYYGSYGKYRGGVWRLIDSGKS